MDGVRSTRRIAEVLREIDADIICLQEVHQRLPWSGMRDQPGHLSRLLGKQVLFQANYGYGLGGFGNAILTALPIAATHSYRLPNRRERSKILRLPEKRGLFQTEVETPGGRLSVFTTHWSLNADDRMETAGVAAQWIHSTQQPTIVCGDFNSLPGSAEMQSLIGATGLTDSGVAAGEPTFTSDRPSHRIDYVLVSAGIRISSLAVIQTLASDHFPVVLDFELDLK